MRWLIALPILLHGLIHFMGAAKGFGFAELRTLSEPVTPRGAVLWSLSGIGVVVSALLFVVAPRLWWIVGLMAVVLSQAIIFTAWSDAKAGTVANGLLLILALYGFVSEGPSSFRAQFRSAVQEHLAETRAETRAGAQITEHDLAHLPAPVQRYVRQAGVVGQPRVTHFRATWTGRIRATADDPWMAFTAEQFNFIETPARFFLMDARKAGLPVDVLHVYEDGSASMRVRLVSLIPLVESAGPELTRAETVTLLNDLSILAPGALVEPGIRWEPLDDLSARAEYTIGANTISAVLFFDDTGSLVDFVSDDRLAASSDGTQFTRQRWSTPLSEYRRFGPYRVAGHGEGRWHPVEGDDFAYIELDLLDVDVNPRGGVVRSP
jgi:hypothetical protein